MNLQQLASALHLSAGKARVRLERLLALRWLDQPLVLFHRTESGLETFFVAPGFIPVREEKGGAPAQPVLKAALREVVIAHSRQKYARPRAEVERHIADLNDWELPETELPVTKLSGNESPEADVPLVTVPGKESSETASTEIAFPDSHLGEQDAVSTEKTPFPPDPQQDLVRQQAVVRRKLLNVGIPPEQADELLEHFDWVRIQRQLMWLPYRNVRNRAGFLLAAIKDDYAAPPSAHRIPPDTSAKAGTGANTELNQAPEKSGDDEKQG